MTYCVKCGVQVDESMKFCPQCGAKVPEQQYSYYQGDNDSQQNNSQQSSYEQNTYQTYGEEMFDPQDVKQHKGMGILSYFGIFVLIPIFAGDKDSPYIKFHSNQGLVLFLVSVILDLVEGFFNFMMHMFFGYGENLFSGLFNIVDFALFILMIMGIVAACKGKKKELPLIGQIQLLK